ncbi:MAG: PucR family transcriptional regulator [Mycobacteriaceae bacterium]
MIDKKAPLRTLKEKKDPRVALPDTLLRRVKQYSGRLSTEAVHSMHNQLPFFADLEASQRASVQLVVQAAVVNFVEWVNDPEGNVRFTIQAFQVVPQDLARRITLKQTVDMVRVAMEFFEHWLPLLARNDEQLVALTEAILRYGRDLGFAAASVYAAAAESRGAWDTRLEALVVDAVVRGDTGADMLSRAATLNWDAAAAATVLIGTPPPDHGVSTAAAIHTIAQNHGRAVLSVVQGTRLVCVVNGKLSTSDSFLQALLETFSADSVVIGPTMPTLGAAHASAVEALAGMEAVQGWRGAPRPVFASELLPERALLGDPAALLALNDLFVVPLATAGGALAETLDAYLDSGGAIESCARGLFVHPNTVRYRLRKIAEITGRDPTNARDAYVLRVASTVGRLSKSARIPRLDEPVISRTSLPQATM